MRHLMFLFFASLCASDACALPSARWEGRIQIPGRELTLVVDLAQDSTGTWTGSVILPGLGIKGAPLGDLVVKETEASFAIKDSLSAPGFEPARCKTRLTPAGGLNGEFLQGGLSAPFELTRTGAPQVEPPRVSTSIAREFEGEWKGRYELMGYPRDVTLKLSRPTGSAAAAAADFVIVGKKTNQLPVDLLTQTGDFLAIESRAFGITFEARLKKEAGELQGVLTQGPFELPLVLRRSNP